MHFTLKVLGLVQKFCTCFCLKKYAVGFCFLQLRPISRLKCTANWYRQESLFSLPCQEDRSEAEPRVQSKVNRGNLRLRKRWSMEKQQVGFFTYTRENANSNVQISDTTISYNGAGVTGILKVCSPTVPALFMAGLAPFRAHNLFPPKGTYCWDEGKLSVLRSCLLCLSRRIECTAFRKSFLCSGELKKRKEYQRQSYLLKTAKSSL